MNKKKILDKVFMVNDPIVRRAVIHIEIDNLNRYNFSSLTKKKKLIK